MKVAANPINRNGKEVLGQAVSMPGSTTFFEYRKAEIISVRLMATTHEDMFEDKNEKGITGETKCYVKYTS